MEKAREFQEKKIYFYFIDYTKAFDYACVRSVGSDSLQPFGL